MTTDTETKIKTTRKWFSADIQRQKKKSPQKETELPDKTRRNKRKWSV